MSKKLIIIEAYCPQNHRCPSVKICPMGALTQDGFFAPKINYDKCVACGKCADFCPKRALVLQDESQEEIKSL